MKVFLAASPAGSVNYKCMVSSRARDYRVPTSGDTEPVCADITLLDTFDSKHRDTTLDIRVRDPSIKAVEVGNCALVLESSSPVLDRRSGLAAAGLRG